MDHLLSSPRLLPVLLLVAISNTPGCVSSHGNLHARGTVAERAWTAEVDHPVARDYLEGRPLPLDLQEIRRAHVTEGTLPSEGTLGQLTARYSTDVATLFFAEALSAHQPSRSIQREYSDVVRRLTHGGEVPTINPSVSRLTVLFAPGWFYETYGAETGADFERQLAQLGRVGVPGELIETDENGTVESNAEIIADWALNPTVCWLSQLNLGVQGFDLEGAMSLQTSRRRPHFASLRFPEHLLLVSYVPVPLSGDISREGALGYSRMRDIGPNDGLTMLVDQLLPGGLTIVEPGVDHYFGHPDRELRSLALLEVLLKQLGAVG